MNEVVLRDAAGRLNLTRRGLLRYAALAAAAGVVPLWRLGPAAAAQPILSPDGGYLTAGEMAILDAATAQIIPTDALPGARECGAINYIQSMLSFMPGTDSNCDRRVNAADILATIRRVDGHAPGCPGAGDVDGDAAVTPQDIAAGPAAAFNARPVFGGGPFSGRNPQAHFPTGTMPCAACHGTTSTNFTAAGFAAAHGTAAETVDNYPPNAFMEFLPLSRLHTLSWKMRLLGAGAVAGEVSVDFNNPLIATSIEIDLRSRYREGLTALDTVSQQRYAGRGFVQLTTSERALVFGLVDQQFITLLHYHTIEGMLCAPEYGGNFNRTGWNLIGFGGDSQPLGYAIYDPSVEGHYRERPDKPNSTANPDEDCGGFSEPVQKFLATLINVLKPYSQQFPCPYCLDVTPPCPPSASA